MRILFLGDVMGRTGRDAVVAALPVLRRDLKIDVAVVNGENASHGFGLAPDMAEALFAAGADAITLGNHSWDRKEIIPYIAQQKRLIRPLNYPPGTPGEGVVDMTLADGRRVLVVQVMGRLFMDAMDCPFRAAEAVLARARLGVTHAAILVDFHGEATSEKMAFAHAFDGAVSAVLGTHTHCPTADCQVLPGGAAFMADVGMCGDYDSVIGMGKAPAIARFTRKMPGERLQPAEGEATICGALIETGVDGRALRIEPIRLGGRLARAMPSA
ncbi:TIGR00282 family metallophosphoesterase [Acidiphilium sp.]|uniref:TIGR00282 family metallophosphoesterase n=1 Tax=Acidiphilium sp. TaxID=527 RepID=UPI003D025D09